MHRLLLIGLNHTTAPLAVREKLAFNAQQRQQTLAAFRQRFPGSEAVLISTCNRVELYATRPVQGSPKFEELIEFVASLRSVAVPEVAGHLYRKVDRDAVTHLFNVAASLDSMVLGETQILGQVRDAYDAARESQSVGPTLNPLFQRAIAVGKEVMTHTALNEGRLSIASVAVDYARRIFDTFADKTVLSIGAGKMATLVLQGFHTLRPGRLLICNRDQAKARSLTERFGGQAVGLDQLADHLVAADIVISSTGAPHPIITRDMFQSLLHRRRYRPVFLIDIALPRDIEAGVADLENVYLYNIDDLQQVVAATQSQRAQAVADARAIVERHVAEFAAAQRAREVGPLIDRLYRRSHRLAQEEIARVVNKLPGLSPDDRLLLENMGRRIVNKLLHDPVDAVRNPAGGTQASTVSDVSALERLFNLSETDEQAPEGAAGEDRPDA